MSVVRILVSDRNDHRTRVWIRALSQENIEVKGSNRFTEILRLLDKTSADLWLVNVDALGLEDQGALLAIHDSFPKLPIVGFSNASPNLAQRHAIRFCIDKVITRPIFTERVIALFPPLVYRYLCPQECC